MSPSSIDVIDKIKTFDDLDKFVDSSKKMADFSGKPSEKL